MECGLLAKLAMNPDMRLAHCERLVYVCNASDERMPTQSPASKVPWNQVTSGRKDRGRRSSSTGRARHFLSCQDCNELAEITIETLISQDQEWIESTTGETIPVQPGKCPRCSTEFIGITTLNLSQSHAEPHALLEFHDPPTDSTDVVLVDAMTLQQAQQRIAQCEHCTEDAEITFDYLLDTVTGCDPTITQYVLYAPAICPNCRHEVTEKTLVIPD